MAVHYRTQGLIIKKMDRGEADQIFVIYTNDFGKLNILGKAIRKIKSKLKSGAELFYLSEIEFIQGKAFKTLTDAILIEKYKNIRGDLEKLKIAYQISEILNCLVGVQEKDEKIWKLLNESFSKLNNCELGLENSLRILYYYFLWNLLSILGYQIDFYNCAICRQKLSPFNLYFNAENGVICSKCCKKAGKCDMISPEVIKIIRLFLKKDWNTLSRLKIEEKYWKYLDLISQKYLSYHKFGIID